MKIGIIGQTHGDFESIRETAKILRRLGATAVFHLGAAYDDAGFLEEHGMPVSKVPGVEDNAYTDASIPNRKIETIEGVRVLLTHLPKKHANDLPDDTDPVTLCFSGEVDVVCHSAVNAWIDQIGQVVFMSPGSLSGDSEEISPTFGLLELKSDKVRATIFDLESGKPKQRKTYPITRPIG